jgi:hypothetical protein
MEVTPLMIELQISEIQPKLGKLNQNRLQRLHVSVCQLNLDLVIRQREAVVG